MVENGSFCSTESRQSFFRYYILLFLRILLILPSGHSCTRSPTLIRCTLRRTQFEFQTHSARVQYLPRSMNSLVFTAWIQKNKLVGPACLFSYKRFLKKEPIEHMFFHALVISSSLMQHHHWKQTIFGIVIQLFDQMSFELA